MIKIFITLKEIVKSGYWEDFCSKYGYSEWAIAEGMDDTMEVLVSREDLREWKLLDNK